MTCYFFWRGRYLSFFKHVCLYRLERAQTIAAQQFPIQIERVCLRNRVLYVRQRVHPEQDRECKVMCIALIMY